MGEHLLKHINILKTIPSIKKNIEELKFGCKIQDGCNTYTLVRQDWSQWHSSQEPWFALRGGQPFALKYSKGYEGNKLNEERYEIIGAIHSGHLRMFGLGIDPSGQLTSYKDALTLPVWYKGKYLQLDNTKPYTEQSEDFFKKLNDYLEENFNINL